MSPSEYEQLVLFLGERFETIDRRLDIFAGNFDAIGHRFDTMDRRFENLELRFDEFRAEIRGRFEEAHRRVDRLEQASRVITQSLGRIEAMLTRRAA